MGHKISISDDTLRRLKALAEPFVDHEPEDVIRRLLDQSEQAARTVKSPLHSDGANQNFAATGTEHTPSVRAPRERGVVVQIGDRRFEAVSVRDLYTQALKFLVEHHRPKLQQLLPLKTSRQRYLIALKPIHPSGNPFVVPVEYRGVYMEAHKDYNNALGHLGLLSSRLGLTLAYNTRRGS
jgi:hypothetical protein